MTAGEWIGAAVIVGLLALFLWRSGAPPRHIVLLVAVAVLGIAATALAWDFLASRTR